MQSSNRLMTSAGVSRLPLQEVAAALRKITEVLASELAAPTETAPDWSDFEWCLAQAVAAMHGVSPLLSNVLRWRGPENWEGFLHEQRRHTLERHQRLAQLLADIGSQAHREGIPIVPLKGAALHEIGIYKPGERPMSDIDLLVKSADMEATARLLGAFGYYRSFATWKHGVFETDATRGPVGFAEHSSNPIKIELHSRVAERLPVVDRDVSELVFPRQPLAGLNSYPSITSLMIHLLLHAAADMCLNDLRLLHLHDIALLARHMTGSDWEGVFEAASGRKPWWVAPPLALAARYYSSAIPDHIAARTELDCPWLLSQSCRRQTLSDVSLSNLWIEAFPGVKWSNSAIEALRYVIGRVIPNEEVLAGRKQLARNYPGAAQSPWSRLSQTQRIVRWLFSRRPRTDTLSSVRAALAQMSRHPSQLNQYS